MSLCLTCTLAPTALISPLSFTLVLPPSRTDVIRLLGVARVAYLQRVVNWGRTDIHKQLLRIAYVVFTLTFAAAAVIEVVENDKTFLDTPQELTFFESYYMVVMSITTVGYGDVAPRSGAGRVAIMLMMGSALLTIPKQTNKLVWLMSRRSGFSGAYAGRRSWRGGRAVFRLMLDVCPVPFIVRLLSRRTI